MNNGKSSYSNRISNGGVSNNRPSAIRQGSSKILQRNNIISNNQETPDLSKNKGKAQNIGTSGTASGSADGMDDNPFSPYSNK